MKQRSVVSGYSAMRHRDRWEIHDGFLLIAREPPLCCDRMGAFSEVPENSSCFQIRIWEFSISTSDLDLQCLLPGPSNCNFPGLLHWFCCSGLPTFPIWISFFSLDNHYFEFPPPQVSPLKCKYMRES